MHRSPAHRRGPSPELVPFRLRTVGRPPAEVVVHVAGEIDICTSAELTRLLATYARPPGHPTSLIVDLTEVTFIGVRGISILLLAASAAERNAATFGVVGADASLLRVFELMGVSDALISH